MLRVDWPSLGFLIVGLLLMVAATRYSVSFASDPVDTALHDSYYVVAHWHVVLAPPAASILFALVYFVGRQVLGLEFRPVWVWLHLILWIVGMAILLGPQYLLNEISRHYTVGYKVDFDTFNLAYTLGYCVTLLSTAVFAICIGEAIFKRLRRGKEL